MPFQLEWRGRCGLRLRGNAMYGDGASVTQAWLDGRVWQRYRLRPGWTVLVWERPRLTSAKCSRHDTPSPMSSHNHRICDGRWRHTCVPDNSSEAGRCVKLAWYATAGTRPMKRTMAPCRTTVTPHLLLCLTRRLRMARPLACNAHEMKGSTGLDICKSADLIIGHEGRRWKRARCIL